MSVSQRIKALFGSTDDSKDGLALLEELLAEREAELTLTATYGRPHPNMTDEPTVVFPYTLYTDEGEQYGSGAKEFVIPDDGLNDTDAPLTQFIAGRLNVEADEVDFSALTKVEGSSADATLNDDGDVEVSV